VNSPVFFILLELLSPLNRSYFEKTERLKAAELIAFEILNPVLRSRGAVNRSASQLLSDKLFYEMFRNIFKGNPTGNISFPSLSDAFERMNELEQRIQKLETSLKKLLK